MNTEYNNFGKIIVPENMSISFTTGDLVLVIKQNGTIDMLTKKESAINDIKQQPYY